MKKTLFFILSILSVIGLHTLAWGKIEEGKCSTCHTMHNSQGGLPMAFQINETFSGYESASSPNPGLLITNCIGCHSSTGSATIEDGVPIVFNMSEPVTYLAGGNFYWVMSDDTKGHNVLGISGVDGNLSEAPGSASGCANSCHKTLAVKSTGDPAGYGGCEGCHMMSGGTSKTKTGYHHNNDGTGTKYVDTAAKGWYRFLGGHYSGDDFGVKGIEDEDWQYTTDSTDHNEYLGVQWDGGYGFGCFGHTMTAYCTGCHGVFHSNQGSGSPWLRHPSDAVIKNEGEYANAFGAGGTGTGTYDPLVPVARPSLSAVSPTVNLGTDMVMCLSCHRAHGSPYYKMMRWDYKSTNLSDALYGCSKCHTTKN